jgi:dTDP-4-dehydrorhamnose 3,5-epimerase
MNTQAIPSLYTDLAQPDDLVAGVVARKLRVNRDPRGILVETLKTEWDDCYDAEDRPFAQTYYSVTEPWVARDEDRWHVHERQSDRFVIPSGDVVIALYDPRAESPTLGRLNLVRLGDSNGDDGQYLLLIPPCVLHCFMVVGPRSALLLNYPTHLWDPTDEGRVPFSDVEAHLPDGTPFTWDALRALQDGTRDA